MVFYTSLTSSFIPKARVLGKTLKQHNPNAQLWLLLSDELPKDFNLEQEPFDGVLYSHEITLNCDMSVPFWFYLHDVTELCTAVKGWGALKLLEITGADKIVYLDPDIAVFDSFDDLEKQLDTYDIIVTPHRLMPEPRFDPFYYGDHQFYTRGVFNLGFVAVKNSDQGINFLKWWHKSLETLCYVDDPNGLFTDQKLIDLAPAFFDKLHISRDARYNISWWNITQRHISGSPDNLLVNGRPVCFYHFSQFDSGLHKQIITEYCNDNKDLWDLFQWYSNLQNECGYHEMRIIPCKYNTYDHGEKIKKIAREQSRRRSEIVAQFGHSDPYCTILQNSLYNYYKKNNPEYLYTGNDEPDTNSVEYLQHVINNKEGHISLLIQTERNLKAQIDELSAQNEFLVQQLSSINSMCKWYLASKLKSVRESLPPNSIRAMICRILVTLLRHPKVFLKNLTPNNIVEIAKHIAARDGKGLDEFFHCLIYGSQKTNVC